jgi:hypothetical protein
VHNLESMSETKFFTDRQQMNIPVTKNGNCKDPDKGRRIRRTRRKWEDNPAAFSLEAHTSLLSFYLAPFSLPPRAITQGIPSIFPSSVVDRQGFDANPKTTF